MAIPAIPTNFYVQQADGNVYLIWDFIAGATSYTINRSTDGVTYTQLGTSSINNYEDTTATVNTLYYYQVASTNTSGTSPFTAGQAIVPTLQGKMSLAALRLAAQQRADRLYSNFVTLPEWNSYINQSYFELYDLLVTKFDDYFVNTYQFTTSGTNKYSLPNDYYKLMGVDLAINTANNAWITLHKFNFADRNKYIFPNQTANYLGVFNIKYRVLGNDIEFIPTPTGNQTIQITYIPRMSSLLKDTDVADGVSGWTEYIIVDAAIKALQKEESDVTVLMAQKAALIERINGAAENRDAGEPDTIADVRGDINYNFWPNGGMAGY